MAKDDDHSLIPTEPPILPSFLPSLPKLFTKKLRSLQRTVGLNAFPVRGVDAVKPLQPDLYNELKGFYGVDPANWERV